MKNKFILCFCLLALLCGVCHRADGKELWQVIDSDRYRTMSQFERSQYDKAYDMLRNAISRGSVNECRAAASEFERFKVQYPNSIVLPYILFYQAFSLHMAKDRNKAISVYNEVIDFFGNEEDAAATAMYYRGVAQFDNGDYTKGMQTMHELLDPEKGYPDHAVAASATLEMVKNYWRLKEPEKAETYLKKTFEKYRGTDAAVRAKKYYMASCISTGKIDSYVSWYKSMFQQEAMEKKIKSSQFNVNMVNEMYDVIHEWPYTYVKDEALLNYRGGKKGTDIKKELWKFMLEYSASYDKAGQQWDFFVRSLGLLSYTGTTLASATEFDRRIKAALDYVASVPDDEKDKNRQQERIAKLFDILFRSGRIDHAAYVNQQIKEDKVRMWNVYRCYYEKRQWREAIDQADAIIKKFPDNRRLCLDAGWGKARIYHHYLREYDKAIQAYNEVNDPPSSLFEIAECHKGKKEHDKVFNMYNVIEGSFTREAPEAAWRRANYYKQIGDRKRAIASARHIMKKYAKSQQASWAHQFLEGLGVDETGLGADEDEY